MIIRDREAFDRHWQGKRLMMGQGPWLMAYNRALVQARHDLAKFEAGLIN